MRVRELVETFRREVDDPLVPGGTASQPDQDSLWKSDELVEYFSEAQREVVRRTFVLFGRTNLAVTAEEDMVELPSNFMSHRRARLLNAQTVIEDRNVNELDGHIREDYGTRGLRTWEDQGPGLPLFAVYDDQPGFLRLVPPPAKDDTLELLYFRWPAPITRSSSDIEVDTFRFKRALLHWMKKIAYEKQDADALDFERAQAFELAFEREIERIYGEIRRETRRPGTTRYGGL